MFKVSSVSTYFNVANKNNELTLEVDTK